ncbi:hypothetical protein ANPL_03385 [Anaplasma platys]|uniref:Phosphatidylglycerophosphatase n=1 Tax=Anaplasma platys TaxID=949 RepID=A0A858PYR3_9RICK|nr:phosphatidylglycerophosphatase [Anaplasma platys]QJC27735.1 hypothetical protein ANPL_03385 [Anaplasma platys]
MLGSLFRLVLKLVSAILPVRLVNTFLGVGYLPAWQEHWASLLVLIVTHVSCYIVQGSPPSLAGAAFNSGLIIAPFFLQVALGLLVLGVVSMFIYNNERGSGESLGDAVVIQIAFGQLLTAAVSMPAVVTIYEGVIYLYNKVCIGIFMCPIWFNYFMNFTVFFVIPFVFFNLVIVIKPWPMSTLQLRYNNCVSVMSEGAVLALYSAIAMYIIAFVFLGLQVTSAIKYGQAVLYLAFTGVA